MKFKKKLCLFLLVLFVGFWLVGCKKTVLNIYNNAGEMITILDLEVGEESTLEAMLIPKEESVTVTWDSEHPVIASIDQNGSVIALSQGQTTITATYTVPDKEPISAEVIVTVTGELAITIQNETLEAVEELELVIGETISLSTQITPSEEIVLSSWTSSDLSTIYVDSGGNVTALSVGSATITATYSYHEYLELSDEIVVTAKNLSYQTEKISITGRNVVMIGKTIDLKGEIYPNHVFDEVIWTTNNEDIASITPEGILLGKSIGTVLITATAKSNSNIQYAKEIIVVEAVNASNILGANYIVDEITAYHELPYGVIHSTNRAFTSTPLSGVDADGYSGITEEIVPDKLYPQQVNVLEVPSSTDIRITTWANLDGHKWALATVRALINKYEEANPGWKVIAAINGDFFDIGAKGNLPYQTSGAMVSNGEFYKTSTGRTVGFTNDGSTNTLIGNEVVKRTEKMILAIYDENNRIVEEFDIDKLNQAPGSNETSIYFATYNSDKEIVSFELDLTGKNGYVVGEAIKALPNNATDFYGLGVISSTKSTTITKGNFAIVTNNETVNNALAVGKKIRCQFEYIGAYAAATDITGGGVTLLPATTSAINDRAPRTVIGQKEDGTIVMMVIDGRQGNKAMYGADARELAAIMSAYGCVEAYNLDGGGSSTMVIRSGDKFITTNSPSDGKERSDANCVLIVVRDPIITYEVKETTQTSATLTIDVVDTMGKDVNKVFIKFNQQFYEVVDNQVVLEQLVHNTQYTFDIYFETSKQEMRRSLSSGSFKTLKNMPEYYTFVVEETDEAYEFYIYYRDDDGASTLPTATLRCNGFTLFMRDGRYTFKKSYIKDGSPLSDISLSYSYALGMERRIVVEIEKVDYLYIDHRTK
ncbi:MAG TPA: phosphodiester glycosidase family protein [Bacilli bacterium]|nr:phosphodiester glycosidase family protein [Bacilli bacterium]